MNGRPFLASPDGRGGTGSRNEVSLSHDGRAPQQPRSRSRSRSSSRSRLRDRRGCAQPKGDAHKLGREKGTREHEPRLSERAPPAPLPHEAGSNQHMQEVTALLLCPSSRALSLNPQLSTGVNASTCLMSQVGKKPEM